MLLRVVGFVAASTLIMLGGGLYTAFRLVRPLPVSQRARRILTGLTVAVFLLPLLGMTVNFLLGPADAARPLTWVAMTAFAPATWLVTVAVLGHILRLGERMLPGQRPVDPERRRLLQTAVTVSSAGASTILLGVGTKQALEGPKVQTIEVPIAGLPEAFDGYTIAQISDLHVGLTIHRDYVEMVMERVSNVGADAIAVTGDLVDGSVADLRRIAEPLKELRARDGVFFSTGNHEYISGVDPWLDEVARYGMTPLLNEHRVVSRGTESLVIAGIADRSAGRFGAAHEEDAAKALAGAPAGAKRILLAHQPVQVEKAAPTGVDLQLSGHTHGGQYFPWNYAIHLVQPYVAGLHRHEDTWLYVNRGTGYWGPPVRLGTSSEISKIILRRA